LLLVEGNSLMSKVDRIIEKIRTKIDRHPILILVLISLAIQLFYLSFRFPLWWDSYVYVGMGKYLTSQGESGLFELFRPPLLPLMLGWLWRIGFDPLVAGPILDVIFSLMVVLLTWAIGKRIFNETIGFYAGLLVSFNPIFLMHTGLILTEPLAMVLMLTAIYLLVTAKKEDKQYGRFLLVGIITALSFLAKFPQGILLPAIILSLFIDRESEKTIMLKVKQCSLVMSGFLLLIIPYLWMNYIYFNDPLAPLKSGSWIVTTATWLYGSGITYYISHFFLLSPVFFLFFAYLWNFVREKKYGDGRSSLLVLFTLLMITYFLTVPRKEPRYLVTIVPALAILSIAVVEKWYHSLRRMEKPTLYPSALIVLCVMMTLIFVPQAFSLDSSTDVSDDLRKVLVNHPTSTLILTNEPSPASFTDNSIVLFGGMDTATAAYEWYKNDSGLIVVNNCSFICSLEDERCSEQKENLLEKISQENKQIFHKTVKGCTTAVYEQFQINQSSQEE